MIKGLFVPNTELDLGNKIMCKTNIVPCPYKVTRSQQEIRHCQHKEAVKVSEVNCTGVHNCQSSSLCTERSLSTFKTKWVLSCVNSQVEKSYQTKGMCKDIVLTKWSSLVSRIIWIQQIFQNLQRECHVTG